MNQKGFSIIELIISVSVIAIISTITIIGFRGAGRESVLKDQSRVLKTGIEQARGMSLAATMVEKEGEQVDKYFIDIKEDGYVILKGSDREKRYTFQDNVIVTDGTDIRIAFEPPYLKVHFWREDNGRWEEIEDDQVEIEVNFSVDEIDPVKVTVNRAGLVIME